jgi:hypothetical protein
MLRKNDCYQDLIIIKNVRNEHYIVTRKFLFIPVNYLNFSPPVQSSTPGSKIISNR